MNEPLPPFYNLPSEQRKAMLFIVKNITEKGESPTLEEIAEATGRKVPNVHKTLKALEERKLITREPRSPRGITLIEEEKNHG